MSFLLLLTLSIVCISSFALFIREIANSLEYRIAIVLLSILSFGISFALVMEDEGDNKEEKVRIQAIYENGEVVGSVLSLKLMKMSKTNWIYNGKTYQPIDDITMQEFHDSGEPIGRFAEMHGHPKLVMNEHGKTLVVNTTWRKCFWLQSLSYSGYGNRLKAFIQDVYNDKYHWIDAERLRFVEEVENDKEQNHGD